MKQNTYIINRTTIKKGLANAYLLYHTRKLSIHKGGVPYRYVQVSDGTLDIQAALFPEKVRDVIGSDKYNHLGLENLVYDNVIKFTPENILDSVLMLGSLYDLAMTEDKGREQYVKRLEAHLSSMITRYKVNMTKVNKLIEED